MLKINSITTNSSKETFQLAVDLSKKLTGGEVLALEGDLGSGKTIFTKGLAWGLGIKEIIVSPTFVILKQYRIRNKKLKNLIHIDCYRLKSFDDALTVGMNEYLGKKNNICVIEWPGIIKRILPENTIWVKFAIVGENKRKITINNI